MGSVGTRCWVILLLGRDSSDPLFLQAKEAPRSVLERFAGRSEFANQGQRVVEGQRLMQAASDIFLGWLRQPPSLEDLKLRDLYVRQLWDSKISADIAAMGPSDMALYARLCAWTLARAHARSGDSIAIASYLGSSDVFDRAIADFRRGLCRPERARPRRAPPRHSDRACTSRSGGLSSHRRRQRTHRARSLRHGEGAVSGLSDQTPAAAPRQAPAARVPQRGPSSSRAEFFTTRGRVRLRGGTAP